MSTGDYAMHSALINADSIQIYSNPIQNIHHSETNQQENWGIMNPYLKSPNQCLDPGGSQSASCKAESAALESARAEFNGAPWLTLSLSASSAVRLNTLALMLLLVAKSPYFCHFS